MRNRTCGECRYFEEGTCNYYPDFQEDRTACVDFESVPKTNIMKCRNFAEGVLHHNTEYVADLLYYEGDYGELDAAYMEIRLYRTEWHVATFEVTEFMPGYWMLKQTVGKPLLINAKYLLNLLNSKYKQDLYYISKKLHGKLDI